MTEVVAVSVLHGSTGQKKPHKNTAQAGSSAQSFITSHDCRRRRCPLCWICSLDPCGERKGTSVMGYKTCCDLGGHGYRLSSWDPDSLQRLAGSTVISAASRPTTPETPAVRQRRQEETFHLQEKKAFPTGSQAWPHLKESRVSKWMWSNLDS